MKLWKLLNISSLCKINSKSEIQQKEAVILRTLWNSMAIVLGP